MNPSASNAFVSALPPTAKWYQSLEHRVSATVQYTVTRRRGAPHTHTPRLFFTAFIWRGGTLPRTTLVAAWHALLSSRDRLRAASNTLATALPNATYMQAHLAAVQASLDESIGLFRDDLTSLHRMESLHILPTSWARYDGDPLSRLPSYGCVSEGLFAAAAALRHPIPRVDAAIEAARSLVRARAPGKWEATESTPSLTRCTTLSSSASQSPPSTSSRQSTSGDVHDDPVVRFRRAWPGRRWAFDTLSGGASVRTSPDRSGLAADVLKKAGMRA
ncbi:unnamed protein product [Cutaneotrichosporon oleaginosum]